MRIIFVVSGNGYGHLKRVCDVAVDIFRLSPQSSVFVLGASHHQRMLQEWGVTERLKTFTFSFINAHTEDNLVVNPAAAYTLASYERSLDVMREEIVRLRPDRLVSDNLVGVLRFFPETILMGSFLFCNTLRQTNASPDVLKICDLEDDLLKRLHPVMLGVEDMVMDYVSAKTNFQGLPWFCERGSSGHHNAEKKRILVTGGGTATATKKLLRIIEELLGYGKFDVYVDHHLHKASADGSSIRLFSFSKADFQTLDWIVCRPGIGILTDAVRYGIPVCAVAENDPEIAHNGRRVEQLRLGVVIDDFTGLGNVLDRDTQALVESLLQRKTGGSAIAASYILNLASV